MVIYGSLETISGGYLYDRVLVAHLREQGDHVEVISQCWKHYTGHLIQNFDRDVYQHLLHADYDVLLQDELNHSSLVLMNRRLRGRVAYPIVSIVHHLRCSEARPVWQNVGYRAVEQRYLRGVDGFVFNSQTTRAAVEKLTGPGRPSVVAHPAGDRFTVDLTDAGIVHRAAEQPLRVLFVGNLIERKGLHILIEALSRLPAGTADLTIVGNQASDRAYTARIHALIARYGLESTVRLAGTLSDSELAGEMRRSHVLAVPSSYEGFGIVYLEGMGFGLPGIASTAGAAGEIIADGTTGFLAAPGDVSALVSHLTRLAADRSLLIKMSRAARRRFEAHPTWAESTAAIRAFLQGMALPHQERPIP
ncbi:MAG: glycosyltransferase family 4 protein [Anaerolineae bacterium]|nr:glycosyltransferase family 4 protein [Anaerolineae bacterium]